MRTGEETDVSRVERILYILNELNVSSCPPATNWASKTCLRQPFSSPTKASNPDPPASPSIHPSDSNDHQYCSATTNHTTSTVPT